MNLHDNFGVGWEALGMTLPCHFNSSVANHNPTFNIYYDGNMSSPLYLDDSDILNSNIGIDNVGASMIHAHCGKIDNNNFGIVLENMGGVNMSDTDGNGSVYLRESYEHLCHPQC